MGESIEISNCCSPKIRLKIMIFNDNWENLFHLQYTHCKLRIITNIDMDGVIVDFALLFLKIFAHNTLYSVQIKRKLFW